LRCGKFDWSILVKLFETAASMLLAVGAQALAVGVIFAS